MIDRNLDFIEQYIDSLSLQPTLPSIEYRISYLLFYATYYEYSGLEQYKTKALALYDSIIEDYENHDLNFSLYEGIEGLGWACIYLNKCKIIQDDSIFDDLSDYLYKSLDISLMNHSWDLLYGYIGKMTSILSYRSPDQEAKKKEYIHKILEDLNETKQVIDQGYFWLEEDKYKSINLGLAHGTFSILLFLLKIKESGFDSALLADLIEGTKNGILGSVSEKKSINIFANGLSLDKQIDLNLHHFSRLAWCYGDLGALYSLAKYNQYGEDAAVRLLLTQLMDALTLRGISTSGLIHFEKEDFYDPGFCHGIAGIYYLLQISSNLLPKDQYLEDRITYWKNQLDRNLTKVFAHHSDVIYYPGGSGTFLGEEEYNREAFLNGYVGIGLILLSMKYDRYDWSEFLLID